MTTPPNPPAPEWMNEAAKEIFDLVNHWEYLQTPASLAGIMAIHAASDKRCKLTIAFNDWLNHLEAPPPVPVSPPCKEREGAS